MDNLDVFRFIEGVEYVYIYIPPGMFRDGMTIFEAYKEIETFGLTFQTWRMLKNETPNDDGLWANDWWDDDVDHISDDLG